MIKRNKHAKIFASGKKNAAVTTSGNITVVCYNGQEGNSYAAIYGPKSVRPKKHYWFKDNRHRDEYIHDYLKEIRKRNQEVADFKAQQSEKAKQMLAAVKVGDIYVSTWGYEQTNIDFYQIIAIKPASVTVRKIRKTTRPEGFMSYMCLPVKDGFIGKPFNRRFSGEGFAINSYSCALPWDGNEVNSTSYA